MSIGGMNSRVQFFKPRMTPNGQGGVVIDRDNPIPIGEFWAAVKHLSGIEAAKYGGKQSEDYIRFEIRNNPGVNKKSLVVYDGMTLDIEAITPAEKKRGFTWIYAKEAVK